MQRATYAGGGEPIRLRGQTRSMRSHIASAASAGAVVLLLATSPSADAAFSAITGSVTARTGVAGQQTLPAANGPTVTLNVDSPPPFLEFATATQTAALTGDRLLEFSANASSTIGASPLGTQASASVAFTQGFSTPAVRWITLLARADNTAAPNAAASVSLGKTGQPALWTVSGTGQGFVAREGLFLPGSFTFQASANAMIVSPGLGANSAVVGGFVQIAQLSDFVADGVVRSNDLATWRTNFGSTAATFGTGDATGDARTDGGDFLLWQRQLGVALSSATASQVPEPGAVLLAAAAATLIGVARRRAGNRRR